MSLAGVLLLSSSAWSAVFSWSPSATTGVAGYRLYYGAGSGNYTQSIDVGNVTQTTISNLTAGNTYYAAVTAYTTSALESVKSNEVSFVASGSTSSPLTVSLTSPTSGASYTAPANITLTATASDSNATVSYVEFYSGSTRFVTVTSSPYTFAWSNVAAGTYTLTAKAYDSNGAVATSGPVNVTVSGTTTSQAPTVTLSSNGTSFAAPASITLTAAASEVGGTISKVEFYSGSSLAASDTSSPYTATFTGVPTGSYTVTAKAYDSRGVSVTSAPITLSVGTTTTNTPPTVSLTSPANATTLKAPATVTLSANASDVGGSISKVEFYSGTTLVATVTNSPYSVTFTGVSAGTYVITARAYDNQGATATSSSSTLTVQ